MATDAWKAFWTAVGTDLLPAAPATGATTGVPSATSAKLWGNAATAPTANTWALGYNFYPAFAAV